VEVSVMPGFRFRRRRNTGVARGTSATIDPLAGFKDAVAAAQDLAGDGKIGIEMGALLGGLLAYLNSQVGGSVPGHSEDLI
jgi:hypothetical protein